MKTEAIKQNRASPSVWHGDPERSGHAVDVDAAYELEANAYLVTPPTMEERNQLISAMKEFWLTWNTPPGARTDPGGSVNRQTVKAHCESASRADSERNASPIS